MSSIYSNVSFMLIIVSMFVATPTVFAQVTIESAAGSNVPGCEEIAQGCYIPSTATVGVGGTVIFSNTDDAAHTYTSGTPDGGPDDHFDSSIIMPGDSFEWSPTKVGKYDYFCLIHPWMLGTIIVSSSTHVPVTNVELSFVIEDKYMYGDSIVINGKTSDIIDNTPVWMYVFNSNNLMVVDEISVASDGTFTHTIVAEGSRWTSDEYRVEVYYGTNYDLKTFYLMEEHISPSIIDTISGTNTTSTQSNTQNAIPTQNDKQFEKIIDQREETIEKLQNQIDLLESELADLREKYRVLKNFIDTTKKDPPVDYSVKETAEPAIHNAAQDQHSDYIDVNGNEVSKHWYENGQLEYHRYTDDNGNRVEKNWHENGQQRYHEYTDENGNEVVIKWHENGQLEYHHYVDDNGNYVVKEWYEDGQLAYHRYTDENGSRVEKIWYANGKLSHYYYTVDNLNYDVKFWHENGQLENHRYTDENGNEVMKFWHENGQLEYHRYTDENGNVVEHGQPRWR